MTVTPVEASKRTYASELSRTRKIETERRLAIECRDTILREVVELEVTLGVENRWTFASPAYQETLKYMAMRKYHQALDKLQKLVIQRLFELHKLNLARTGEYNFMTFVENPAENFTVTQLIACELILQNPFRSAARPSRML